MASPRHVTSLVGATGGVERVVTDDDTAITIGSGDLPVLATPIMIAMMEAAACAALVSHVAPGSTSVGSSVDVRHRAPSPVGAHVRASATVTGIDGAKVTFDVTAIHDAGDGVWVEIGRGTHARVIVDRAAFGPPPIPRSRAAGDPEPQA